METTALVVGLADMAAIALLPVVFFRRGVPNARWLLTAAPYPAAALALVGAWAGWWQPLGGAARPALAVAGALLGIASIAGIALTVGAHRVPLALWHQEGDAPVELVTWGPYRRVRHPFYASFLVGLAGAACAAPGLPTAACLAAALVLLSWTARAEERRLAASAFGAEYRAYLARTARFFPGLRRRGA